MRSTIACGYIMLLLLLPEGPLRAQKQEFITGRLLDERTRQAVSFAHISRKSDGRGTLSNRQGYFEFRWSGDQPADSLVIQHIAYTTRYMRITGASRDSLEILLTPIQHEIPAVVFQSGRAEDLIREALEKIPQNYPGFNTGAYAFYRETVKENGKTIQQLEAVLSVNKGAYREDGDEDRISIIRGREQKETRRTRLWYYIDFVDGPYEAIQSDFCKYTDFITIPRTRYSFLEPRHFKYYRYSLEKKTDPVYGAYYRIRFEPRTGQKRGIFRGSLKIDAQSLAFTALDYEISPYHVKNTLIMDFFTRETLEKIDIYTETTGYSCSVYFTRQAGYWYLAKVRIDYGFRLLWLNDLYLADIQDEILMVVTDYRGKNTFNIRVRDYVKRRKSLSDQLGVPDREFWEQYDYIVR